MATPAINAKWTRLGTCETCGNEYDKIIEIIVGCTDATGES